MDRRPPKLQKEYLFEVARSVLSSVKWKTWQVGFIALSYLALLNLFSNSVYDLSRGQFHCSQLLIVAVFSLVSIYILQRAEEAAARVNLNIVQIENPPPRRALILFLSPPGKEGEEWLKEPKDEIFGEIREEEARKKVRGSWRMPIEAIAYHLDQLDRVVILPSSDAPGREDGTFRELDRFRETVRWLVGPAKSFPLVSSRELGLPEDKGVDFENARDLVDALNRAFFWLYEQGLEDHEILVDITGGQKIPTVAGAAVALGERRQFQYLSTRVYKVRAYDITYQSIS